MGILKILFILSLISLSLGQIARIDFKNGVAFTAADIFVGILFVVWITREIFLKKRFFITDSTTKAIVIFFGIGIVSLLVNAYRLTGFELVASSLYLIRWIAYAGIYFVVRNFDEEFKKRIPYLLISVGLLTVLLGYIQYVYYNSLKNLFYLGWDDHMYRVFSVFLDPNFVGAFFVLLILLLVLYTNKLLMLISFLFAGLAVFLTHSRSTLIMFLVSGTTYLILYQKKRFIIILILLIIGVTTLFSSQFYIENINPFRTVSTRARIETTSNALTTIKENPLLGVGFNAYRYYQIQRGFRTGEGAVYSHADAGTDNSFLFVFAITGVIGFLAYIFIWKTIIVKASSQIKKGNKEERRIGILVISSLIGLFAHSLFVNSLFYPFLMLWMWVVCGLLSNKDSTENM